MLSYKNSPEYYGKIVTKYFEDNPDLLFKISYTVPIGSPQPESKYYVFKHIHLGIKPFILFRNLTDEEYVFIKIDEDSQRDRVHIIYHHTTLEYSMDVRNPAEPAEFVAVDLDLVNDDYSEDIKFKITDVEVKRSTWPTSQYTK